MPNYFAYRADSLMRWLITFVVLMASSSTGTPKPAPETFVPKMLGYWRADAVNGTNLTDLSGNGRVLALTNVTIATTDLTNGWGVAGRAVATAGGVAASYATAASAAPWKPMHDGTGASWWAVLRMRDTGVRTIFDTGATVSTLDCGVCMRVDGSRGRINIELTNGGGSGYLIDNVGGAWWTWNDTFKIGMPHILVVTFSEADGPDIHIWLDGQMLASLSKGDREKPTPETRPFGSANPSYPLRLLAANGGIQLFAGELAEFGVASGSLSTANRRAIEDWAAEHYGIALTRAARGILLWDGNSLIDNIWRADQFPEKVTPLLRQPQRSVMRAIAGLTVQQMIDRAPKHVTPVYDPDAPFNILAVTEVLNSLAEGETKENTYRQLVSYCQARRVEGWKVVVAPPLPAGAGIKQADLDWVKDQIVANWKTFADAIVRADLDPVIGSWTARAADLEPKIYRSEGVHFTALGNDIYARYWVAAINEVLSSLEKAK
jgi:hypothetical protein